MKRTDYLDWGWEPTDLDQRGQPILTPEDWRLGRKPTGRTMGYDFVEPNQENRTKEDWPYSYSLHYLCGKRKKGCEAVYSDRLAQWDQAASERASQAVADSNCRFGHWGLDGGSKYLSAYYNKPIGCIAIAEGCNVSNGYPYWVFWFRNAKRSA